MTLFQVIFYVMGALALAGGVGVVAARSVVHAALFLILSLAAVAGVYLVLLADFVALVQILLYGGAVTILILFAMMLTNARETPPEPDGPHRFVAAGAATALFVILAAGVATTPWGAPPMPTHAAFVTVSTILFTQWAVPFEIASLVLLVALIGAVVIARQEEPE
ncbi:MAG: NADH-quinone oxidoreductase subunit J [Chloroflexi bacterium]|nr:NADH-quinone oxidoreductase subunit J [Chloroflexota bacterium]